MTKLELARTARLSPRSVTAYENGETEPTEQAIAALSAALEFPGAFFSRPDASTLSESMASFRALSKIRAYQRDAALAAGMLARELSAWIDERFSLPVPDLPDLGDMGPEEAADTVRARWGLGVAPLRNVVHLLELHGARVFSLADEYREIDAFSFWFGPTPFVFLNTVKSAERSRFDAAHELGHLVLHRFSKPETRDAELQANRFASAFLMPRASVLGACSGVVSVDRLIELKANWGVSVGALTRRLFDVGMISEWTYYSFFREIGERGYRSKEPNTIPRETSQVLEKVFRSLRQEGVGKAAVAEALCISLRDLNALVFGLTLTGIVGRKQ